MDSIKNIITVIGVIARVGGLLWILLSYIDFSSAKKNNDGTRQDQATWGMILGAALVAFGPRMAESINTAIDGITF